MNTLDEFLRNWPRQLRVSFEFRHPSWFTDEVYEVLRRRDAALCLAERDEMATPEVLTANFVYLRLRKSAYSHQQLQKLAKRIETYAPRGDVFIFFRQAGDEGASYAQELLQKLHVRS